MSKTAEITTNIPINISDQTSGIVPNCPISVDLTSPESLDAFSLAVRASEYNDRTEASRILSPETKHPSLENSEVAAGHIACMGCVLREDCVAITQAMFTDLNVTHPSNLNGLETTKPSDVDRLTILASLVRVEKEGYTAESSQNVVSELFKNTVLSQIASEVLTANPEAVVEAAGKLELNSGRYSVLGISGVMLAIRNSEFTGVDTSEDMKEVVSYWSKMLTKDSAKDGEPASFIQRCIKKQIAGARKYMTLLSGVNSIYEFRPSGGQTKIRMFGKILDAQKSLDSKGNPTLESNIIPIYRIADSKAGNGTRSTYRHGKATETALQDSDEIVKSVSESADILRLEKSR